MPTLNPEHLLQQAERLIQSARSGAPRQADLRRAISAAYYGVFHAILTAATNQIIGASRRTTKEYGRVYRSMEHKHLLDLCEIVKKPVLPQKYQIHAPAGGFDPTIIGFATGFAELQESRHLADYDPLIRFRSSDAVAKIQTARAMLSNFRRAPASGRDAFLSLLVFPPRR